MSWWEFKRDGDSRIGVVTEYEIGENREVRAVGHWPSSVLEWETYFRNKYGLKKYGAS